MAEVLNDEVDQLPRKKQLQKGRVHAHIENVHAEAVCNLQSNGVT